MLHILRFSILVFFLCGCGLPSSYVVPVPQITNITGSRINFSLERSNGFVLYYRVYEPNQNPNRDLSGSVYSREEDIFRYFQYYKSYPSNATSIIRPRFIWQPTQADSPPYNISLDALTGGISIWDGQGRLVFEDALQRSNLLDFTLFQRGDSDLPNGFGSVTGHLAWAAMNMELNTTTMTIQNSMPVYLHHVTINIG
ncbi:hypothetical protein PVA45_03260 [Entomospira entomophila]|uniref:Lipoprotein n=1 Tax=Entomospira entomophila TaxID=2719988 RepID=A0A968KSN9_9SPIO|nr:hypothetical protein [Entomospira entomophilus]NIZ40532.1 hypothetical protein [Entomospira entomophilus]WDI36090.1 hypothetical protein PVA45_03260 [Entomospira entomophilus]